MACPPLRRAYKWEPSIPADMKGSVPMTGHESTKATHKLAKELSSFFPLRNRSDVCWLINNSVITDAVCACDKRWNAASHLETTQWWLVQWWGLSLQRRLWEMTANDSFWLSWKMLSFPSAPLSITCTLHSTPALWGTAQLRWEFTLGGSW